MSDFQGRGGDWVIPDKAAVESAREARINAIAAEAVDDYVWTYGHPSACPEYLPRPILHALIVAAINDARRL